MSELIYSKYQLALFEEVKKNKENIIIQAVAGSGKSSSLIKCIDYTPKFESILFLAFNKSIVDELKTKLPKKVEVSTLHSAGLKLIKRNTNRTDKINFNKFNLIYEEIISSTTRYKLFFEKDYNKRNFKFFIHKLSDLVKANNTNYNDEDELKELMNFYGISSKYSFDLIIGAIKQICKLSLNWEKYWIDFSDMIWLPIQLGWKDVYNYIFVDEVQDLNKIQMKLLQNLSNDNTRFVFVGDKNQSLYGFAGSNTNSMNDIKQLFNAKEMPLSICYRCPQSHIKEVQKIVNDIEAYDKNPEGYIFDIIENQIQNYAKSGDMVICRTNSPLIQTCLWLIKCEIKSYIKGSDLKQDILFELKQAVEKGNNSIQQLRVYFNHQLTTIDEEIENKELETMTKVDNSNEFEQKEWLKRQLYYIKRNLMFKQDLVYSLLHFLNNKDLKSVEHLHFNIENIFKEDKNAVCCSTIHKAKGLEAETIFLLHPHLLPHPILKGNTEWQQEQEKNVEYVAKTRSKLKLIYTHKEENG